MLEEQKVFFIDSADKLRLKLPPSSLQTSGSGDGGCLSTKSLIADRSNDLPEIKDRELDGPIQHTDVVLSSTATRNDKTIENLRVDWDQEFVQMAGVPLISRNQQHQDSVPGPDLTPVREKMRLAFRGASDKLVQDSTRANRVQINELKIMLETIQDRDREEAKKMEQIEAGMKVREKKLGILLKSQQQRNNDFNMKILAQKRSNDALRVVLQESKNRSEAMENRFNIKLQAQQTEIQVQESKVEALDEDMAQLKKEVEGLRKEVEVQGERLNVQASDIAALVADDHVAIRNIKLRNLLDAIQGDLGLRLFPSNPGQKFPSTLFRDEIGMGAATTDERLVKLKGLLQLHDPNAPLLKHEDALNMLVHPNLLACEEGKTAHNILPRNSYESAIAEVTSKKDRAVYETFLNTILLPI